MGAPWPGDGVLKLFVKGEPFALRATIFFRMTIYPNPNRSFVDAEMVWDYCTTNFAVSTGFPSSTTTAR